jgi:transposase
MAKTVFQVHGADGEGRPLLRRQLKRGEVRAFFARLPPCLIGLEACASSHYWGRELEALGHTVKVIPAQFVKPFVKTQKTDANDAEAISEAVVRPTLRTVAIKRPDQQAVLALHRARQHLIKSRTAQANQIRGLLGEFGIVFAQGIQQVFRSIPEVLEDAENGLPDLMRELIDELYQHLRVIDARVRCIEAQIETWHQRSVQSQRLSQIPGIGVLTATALVASVGDIRHFHSSREFAAWLGLVPRQHSSGGKTVLRGISKRGDAYLRSLLIHGGRSMVRLSSRKPTPTNAWVIRMLERRPPNVACVACANKNARTVWAVWQRGVDYDPYHRQPTLAA